MFEKIMPRISSYTYDPGKIEEMLNRESGKGWQCYETGFFYCFHRGEPNEYEYRVQATGKTGMERLQYTAELRELGIESVGDVGNFLVLRKKADGAPFELYSDLDSLIAQVRRVRRTLWVGLALDICIALQLLTVFSGWYRYAQMDSPAYFMEHIPLIVFIALFMAGDCFCAVQCVRALRHTRERLKKLEAERVIQE